MASTERLFEIKREPLETMQSFWLRFDMILSTLEGVDAVISSGLLFMRALKSLQLNHMQKTSVLTFLECRNCAHDIESIRSTTVRLFGMYSGLEEPTAKLLFPVQVIRMEICHREICHYCERCPRRKLFLGWKRNLLGKRKPI